MELRTQKLPFEWAHRGRNRIAPENTLSAFRASVDAGDAGIELDIALSGDGKLVVIHDDSVDRTTDGHGEVADMTLQQLRELDAGSWFHSDFAGETLPTLDDVLSELGKRILVNIEVKTSAFRQDLSHSVEPLLLETISRAGCSDSVLISSFDPRILTRIYGLDEKLPLALLVQPGMEAGRAADFADTIGAYSIHPFVDDVKEGLPQAYSDFGGKLFPYTVNSQSLADRLISVGVHGYFADLPFPDE